MACQLNVQLRKVQGNIRRLTAFLTLHRSLIDAHTTNFLVDEQWCNLVSAQFRKELLLLSDAELALLPSGKLYEETEFEESHQVGNYVRYGSTVHNFDCNFSTVIIQFVESITCSMLYFYLEIF